MRYLWMPLFLACAPSGDEWIEVNVHHDDNADTSSFLVLTGALEVIPKTSLSGEMELIHQQDGVAICVLNYTVENDQWRDDCTQCEDAFDVVVTASQMLTNLDEACDLFQSDWLDTHPALGFGTDTLFSDDGSGWQNSTETWYADGRTHFEWDLND
jgi:hypothetical protein